jgi:hypothetical protein
VDAHSEIGRLNQDHLVVPGDDASTKDISDFWNKLGRPENRADFNPDIAEIEGLPTSPALLDKAKELAYDNGLNPFQAERLMNGFLEAQKGELDAMRANIKNDLFRTTDALKEEWGDQFDSRLSRAGDAYGKVMEAIGVEDVNAMRTTVLLDGRSFGDTEAFVKMFDKLGDVLSEDALMGDKDTPRPMTPEQSKDALDKFCSENIEILLDSSHPMHKQVDEERNRLLAASLENPDEVVIQLDG